MKFQDFYLLSEAKKGKKKRKHSKKRKKPTFLPWVWGAWGSCNHTGTCHHGDDNQGLADIGSPADTGGDASGGDSGGGDGGGE